MADEQNTDPQEKQEVDAQGFRFPAPAEDVEAHARWLRERFDDGIARGRLVGAFRARLVVAVRSAEKAGRALLVDARDVLLPRVAGDGGGLSHAERDLGAWRGCGCLRQR